MNDDGPITHIFDEGRLRKSRLTVSLVAGAVLLIAAGTGYFTHLQNIEIETRHSTIIQSEVTEAANAIQALITDRERQIQAFSVDNEALLEAFAADVDDEALRAELDARLTRWFPGYFTFTLADEHGTDLIDDIEGFVGNACQANIREYVAALEAASNGHAGYQAVIHPQANNYHFDVMAPWRIDGTLKGVFFVSFFPKALSDILRSYQSPDHHLALVHRERDYLIEVTAQGARDLIASMRDINLTSDEISEIRAQEDIDSSVWRVVGYAEPGLLAELKLRNWLIAIFIIGFTTLGGGISLWRILRLDGDQARILAELADANDSLGNALGEVESRRAQVASLLDNSGQGFLSFGRDLIVDADSSRACSTFLEGSPDGHDVSDRLFGAGSREADLLRSVVNSALAEDDPFRQEMILSLMPGRIDINGYALRLDLRMIGDHRIMAILTDITEEVALSEAVTEERDRSKMISSAVAERDDFFLAVADFRDFIAEARTIIGSGSLDLKDIDTMFRHAHTCKGVLGQFGFPSAYAALHTAENGLAEIRDSLAEGHLETAPANACLDPEALVEAFEADLGVISEALGKDYMAGGGSTIISAEMAAVIADLANRLLKGEPISLEDPNVLEHVSSAAHLTKASLTDILRGYDRIVQQLAARLEKEVEPVSVSGPDIWLDPETYGPMARALVHVFRNAVVHGIESPEDRDEFGKPEAGRIDCSVTREDGMIRVRIADDGRGVDVDAVREALGSEGEGLSYDAALNKIFEDRVSTIASVDDVAGRGVGLPALRAAISDLGGSISVRTSPGRETVFEFSVPIGPDA